MKKQAIIQLCTLLAGLLLFLNEALPQSMFASELIFKNTKTIIQLIAFIPTLIIGVKLTELDKNTNVPTLYMVGTLVGFFALVIGILAGLLALSETELHLQREWAAFSVSKYLLLTTYFCAFLMLVSQNQQIYKRVFEE